MRTLEYNTSRCERLSLPLVARDLLMSSPVSMCHVSAIVLPVRIGSEEGGGGEREREVTHTRTHIRVAISMPQFLCVRGLPSQAMEWPAPTSWDAVLAEEDDEDLAGDLAESQAPEQLAIAGGAGQDQPLAVVEGASAGDGGWMQLLAELDDGEECEALEAREERQGSQEGALAELPEQSADAIVLALPALDGKAARFRSLVALALDPEQDRDDEIVQVGEQLFGSSTMMSLVASAAFAGVHRRKFGRARERLGELATRADRWLRSHLEDSIVAALPSVDLLLYIDGRAFDETPMKIAIREQDPPPSPGEEVGSGDAVVPIGEVTRALKGFMPMDVVPSKLFQTNAVFAMLVRVGGEHLAIRSKTANWLQVLDRNTGECIKHALSLTNACSPAAASFGAKLALVTSDSHSANIRAEVGMNNDREGWGLLHLFCKVHRASTSHTKTFLLVDTAVSGIVRFSLALRAGTAMRQFRAALRAVLLEKLVVLRGESSREASEHRASVLSVFVSRGPHLRARTATLATCLNGDWQNRNRAEVYLPHGATDNKKVRTKLVSLVVWALTSRAPPTYPRHRWTGADEALDYVGLMQSVHGLASSAFLRWLAGRRDGEQKSGTVPPADHADRLPVGDEPVAGGPEPHVEGEGADDREGGHIESGPKTWAEENEANRRGAQQFIVSREIDLVAPMRVVMGPLAELLREYLFFGGGRWECQQRHTATQATPDGTGVAGERKLRLLVAAANELEHKFEQAVVALQGTRGVWQITHPTTRTSATTALIFRLLHRSRSAVFQLLTRHHDGFPFKLFTVLSHPERVDEISQAPDCLLDPFSRWFLDMHPGRDLLTDVAKHKLQLIALMARVDILQEEVGNSRIRRQLMAASHSTHQQHVSATSAVWATREMKRRADDLKRLRGSLSAGSQSQLHRAPRQPVKRPRADPKKKRKSSFGGPLRAYIRLHRGEGHSFAELVRMYKHIGAAEKAKVVVIGRAMTAAGRADPGLQRMSVAKRVQRGSKRRWKDHAIQQRLALISPDAEGEHTVAASTDIVSAGSSMLEPIALARRQASVDSQVKSRRTNAMARDLAAFDAQHQPAMARSLAELAPVLNLANVTSDVAVVDSPFRLADVVFPAHELASRVLAALSVHERQNAVVISELDEAWAAKHFPIMHDDVPEIKPAPSLAHTKCWQAGTCICSGAGKQMNLLRLGWWAMMFKGRFQAHSKARAKLGNGSLICRLDGDNDSDASLLCPTKIEYWHAAFVNFSPLRIHFIKLDCLGENEETGRVVLKTTSENLDEFVAFSRLDRELVWCATWYEIESTLAPVHTIEPDTVAAMPFGDPTPIRFWPPPARLRPLRFGGPSSTAGGGDDPGPPPPPVPPAGDDAAAMDLEAELLAALEEDTEPDGDAEGEGMDGLLLSTFADLVGDDAPGSDDGAGCHASGDEGSHGAAALVEEMEYEPTSPAKSSHSEGSLGFGDSFPLAVEPDDEPASSALPASSLVPAAADVLDEGHEPFHREPADVVVEVEGGKVVYYSNNMRFVAQCMCPGHEPCFKTRTSLPSARLGLNTQAQGRPLGHLLAWLSNGSMFSDKASHMAFRPNHDDRSAARDSLDGVAGGILLCLNERARWPGEPREPVGLA
jgi:hypothetical protein